MIQISALSKEYGERKAINNLNFMIKEGEVTGFLGPNGAGKTTTMKIITGFMPASSGRVLIDGDDVFEKPLITKSKIGYLPEHPPVYGDMKVIDYCKFVAGIKGVDKKSITSFVERALKLTHLSDVKCRLIHNLSKGYRQRVGLAAALVAKPKILILDEPTVGLDPNQVLEFRKLIKSLKGQQTILLSTHILSEVQATCDRIIIINKGEILAQESLESFVTDVGCEVSYKIKTSRQKDNLLVTLRDIPGVKSAQCVNKMIELKFNKEILPIESVARVVMDSGAGLIEFNPVSNSIENLFTQLTSEQKEVRA